MQIINETFIEELIEGSTNLNGSTYHEVVI